MEFIIYYMESNTVYQFGKLFLKKIMMSSRTDIPDYFI